MRLRILPLVASAVILATAGMAPAIELWVGAAQADITPDRPISLSGQFYNRISTNVMSRCTANVLALESRTNGAPADCAILVSLDIVSLRDTQEEFKRYIAARLPGFDTNKLFLAATHTHTGPTLAQGIFPDYGKAMQPKEYVPFMYERMGDAVVKAWEGRKPGSVAWGLGHAVVGTNRRAVYADGKAVMYGDTKKPDFRGLEGWEDHAVDVLLFYGADRKTLVATMIAVPCPAQTVETLCEVSADYWHEVREAIRKKHGQDVAVLGFCAPAGDQSPHLMLRNAAEERMLKLRKLNRLQELARRIADTFEETWEAAQNDIRADVPFSHRVERFEVPGRKLTEKEYAEAKKGYEDYSKNDEKIAEVYGRKNWFKRTLDRYEAQQKADPKGNIEMHVLRIGEVAIATSPFELFVDYAMRIQGRSPAGQTVLIQLASHIGTNGYLPSERAVADGGYSAVPQSSQIGPEGGQMLVERTLAWIHVVFGK